MTLEALERRDCPAVLFDFVQGDEGGILTITGDEEDNYIAMQSVRGGINVVLGDGSVRVFENVAEIVVNSLGGADTVDAPKFWVFGTEHPRLQIHAGAGDDRVTIGDGDGSSVSGRITAVVADPLDAVIDLGTGADDLVFQVHNHGVVNVDVNSADSFDSVQVGVQTPLAHPIRLLETRGATVGVNLAGGGHTVNVQTQRVDVVDLNVVVYAGRAPSDPSGNTIYVSSSGGGVWRAAVNLEGDDNLVDLRTEDIDKVALDLLAAGDHNVVKHELGHTLGFRHEHTRPETAAQANLMFLGDGNEVGFKAEGFGQVDLDLGLTGNGNQAEIALLLPAVQKVREAAARVSLEIDGSNNQGTVSNQGYGKWEVNLAKLVDSDDASAAATQGRSLFIISTDSLPPPGTVPTGTVRFIIDGNQAAPVGDIITIQGQGFGAATVDVDTAGGNDSIWIDIDAPLQLNLATGAGDDDVRVDNQPQTWFSEGPAPIQSISIDTGSGDDKVVVHAQAGDPFPFTRDGRSSGMVVDLGEGNDLADISTLGFVVDSLWLRAGDGHDKVTADSFYGTGVYKSIDSGKTWNVDLGGGNDLLDLVCREFSTVTAIVNGGDGDDTVEVNANAGQIVDLIVEPRNRDTVYIDVDLGKGNDMADIETFFFAKSFQIISASSGNDMVNVRSNVFAIYPTTGLADVAVNVLAGAGDDTVNISTNVTNLANKSLRIFPPPQKTYTIEATVVGGEGNDEIVSSTAVANGRSRLPQVLRVIADHQYNLGEGNDRLQIDMSGCPDAAVAIEAGAGDDFVRFKPLFAFLVEELDNRTRLNLEALLGAGDDRLEADTAGAGQANIVIDGGDGDDEILTRHRMFAVVDRTNLNLVVTLGAGNDTLTIEADGYREVKMAIHSGPEGDGSDSISANVQSLHRNGRKQAGRVVLDSGLDVYEYKALGYLVQGTNPSPISVEWVFVAI